jgi:hypothetical protein
MNLRQNLLINYNLNQVIEFQICNLSAHKTKKEYFNIDISFYINNNYQQLLFLILCINSLI